MIMDYDVIKDLAKATRRRVTDLIALAPNNDPFYCGQPMQVEKAKWFARLWREFGYSRGVHLRRMHYRIVSHSTPIFMVNGLPYENTLKCWSELDLASKAARYLGFVDAEHFIDKRNSAPTEFVDYTTRHTAYAWASGTEIDASDTELPPFPELPHYFLEFSSPQRYHLEMWCEKSTIDDILSPLAEQYHANLQYGLGELSITLAVEALRRFEKSHKPVRILYISDFDPAGLSMPKAMSRKLEFYNQKLRLELDIKLFPIALTAEQVAHYSIERTPIKDTERRKAKFENRYGVDAAELDALEAQVPGELQRILTRELDRYYDPTLDGRVAQAEREARDAFKKMQEQVYEHHQDEINALEGEYEQIQSLIAGRMARHTAQVSQLWEAIGSELEQARPEVDPEDIPTARLGQERDDALFDSSRDYLTQNEVYQAHKGNEEGEDL